MAVHGSGTVFQLGTAASPTVPADISTKGRSVSFPSSIETHEVTTFGATAKSYIPGLSDGTISFEGIWDSVIDGHLLGIERTEVAFVYGAEGSAAGKVKKSGNCILTGYETGSDVNDVTTFSASFQITGPVTRGVF